MKVHEAMARVMEDVQAVAKSDRNSSQGFNFRGIDSVLNAVAPALRKHGVIVMPVVENYDYQTVEIGKNRTAMGHVIVKVRYVFIGPEGDNAYCDVVGEAMDSGDKAVAKAMSVAFRIALLQSLALPTDEPDPDASSYERAPVEVKPMIDAASLDSFKNVMRSATTMEYLDEVANKVKGYALENADREELRLIYLDSKKRIENAEGQSHE